MTLTEYLNQTDPARMPKVILNEGEYITQHIAHIAGDTLTFITIPSLWERFKVGGNYVKVNNEPCLLTQDDDGNRRNYSCFYIPQ